MSWILHDPDEWETVIESHSFGLDPFGNPLGSCGISQRRRSPEEVRLIKAEKQRRHDDAILAEAEAIRARRLSQ